MRQLQDILYKVPLQEVKGNLSCQIEGIALDSRLVKSGMLFAAVKGSQSDGHAFIEKAIEAGAVAVLCEQIPANAPDGLVFVKVEDSAASLGVLADNFYDNPSTHLKLIGITGTNGKTTCVTLLYDLFQALGYRCGMLSTVQNRIVDKPIMATHTTPDVISINKMLAQMVNARCDYVFMEVSSHAADQKRIAGLYFSGGIFTNITHDHLDYHKTFDGYLKAKKSFFDALSGDAFALTNVDDKRGAVMLQNTKAYKKTYSLKNIADFKANVLENHFSGMLVNMDGAETWFKLIGDFNAYNLLAVYATAMLLDQDKLAVLTVLSKLSGAEGRFDCIVSTTNIIGIVDYAHTPDAVQNVLETIHGLRQHNGHIITVIGCGGDRDKSKRPIMAQVACDWSDKIILTSDNPRSEDPGAIIRDMEKGIGPVCKNKTLSISDRKEAIKTACMLANPGDIILVAGKGHEKYQEINGVKCPFDDKEVLNGQFVSLRNS